MFWSVAIFNTRDGSPASATFEPSAGPWDTRLTGRGQGQLTVPLAGSGLSKDTIRDLATGNKYTIVLMCLGFVAYAGVIQRSTYVYEKQMLTLDTQELRVAYLNQRMLFGVFNYVVGGTVLAVANKSLSGATRAVLAKAMSWAWFWELPIDLPADGSGTYSASWKHEERLKLEDHLAQIEAAGCEINFRPYINGSGYLRWATEVATQISNGSATAIDVNDKNGPLSGLQVVTDYAREMTGILGFGKGGTGARPYGYSPGDGAAVIGVRDIWLSFPDLDGARLQQAVQASDSMGYPVEQWSFGLNIYPDGLEYTVPGRLIDLTIAGDPFIPDGTHHMRVIGLRGDLGTGVTVEVQRAA